MENNPFIQIEENDDEVIGVSREYSLYITLTSIMDDLHIFSQMLRLLPFSEVK